MRRKALQTVDAVADAFGEGAVDFLKGGAERDHAADDHADDDAG